jgi:metal-responsive CopG/Arc/MetJ family transcriptional regulator
VAPCVRPLPADLIVKRGRPPGREFTEKIEVWVSRKQLDELDAFCELHLGVKRAEILRRALAAFLAQNTDTASSKLKFERALTLVRERRVRKYSTTPVRAVQSRTPPQGGDEMQP